MKILYLSNAPWVSTGYGVQSKLLVDYLKQQGHEIIFMTNFGLLGGPLEIDGTLHLPDDFGNWGNTVIRYNVEVHQPDVIISLCDWFILALDEWKEVQVPWFSWTPIDLYLTNKEKIKPFLDVCPNVVTMSSFGSKQIEEYKAPKNMIHHAIDSSAFKILGKTFARESLGFPNDPNTFIIGMNMANKDASENRKAFEPQIKAIKKFINKHSELDIFVFLNTEPTGKFKGVDLVTLLKNEKLNLDKFMFTNPYKTLNNPYTAQEMALWYNGLDVLLNASSGEGFGVPIIEAQACGVPVITHDATAMPEISYYGYVAKSDPKIRIELEDYGYRTMPSIQDIFKGLEDVLKNRSEKEAEAVSQKIHENFDIQVIGKKWDETIKAINV